MDNHNCDRLENRRPSVPFAAYFIKATDVYAVSILQFLSRHGMHKSFCYFLLTLSKKGQGLVPTVTWVPFHRYTVQFMLRRYEIIQKADGLIFCWGEAEVNKIAFDFSSKNYATQKPHLSKHRNYLFFRWRLVMNSLRTCWPR